MHHTMTNTALMICQSVFATGAILAAEISHGDIGDWMQMIERLGLAVALVVFFVITGWKREQRMAKRLDWLEKENDKLAMKTATLAEQVNQSLIRTNAFADEALKILNGRTCWAFSTRDEFEDMREMLKDKKKP